jgi:hypothetical protein
MHGHNEALKLLSTLGLKWERSGAARPRQGQELSNAALDTALQSKTEFTLGEWKSFDIKDLRNDSFIQSGGIYFRPAALSAGADEAVSFKQRDGCYARSGVRG